MSTTETPTGLPSQLRELAAPFPAGLIQTNEGQSYVEHPIVTQKLLAILGPFDMEVVQLIRGHAEEVTVNRGKANERVLGPYPDVVTGCLLRCTYTIDGRQVSVTEAGDVERPAMKETDGARAKDAVSDAVKRCAMRVGVGLHLWGKGDYFLDRSLDNRAKREGTS